VFNFRMLSGLVFFHVCYFFSIGIAQAQALAQTVGPDPMRPATMSDAPLQAGKSKTDSKQYYALYSTLVSQGRRLAIINGRSVAVGDVVSGAKVKEIKPRLVRLNKNGKEFTIGLINKRWKKQPVKTDR